MSFEVVDHSALLLFNPLPSAWTDLPVTNSNGPGTPFEPGFLQASLLSSASIVILDVGQDETMWSVSAASDVWMIVDQAPLVVGWSHSEVLVSREIVPTEHSNSADGGHAEVVSPLMLEGGIDFTDMSYGDVPPGDGDSDGDGTPDSEDPDSEVIVVGRRRVAEVTPDMPGDPGGVPGGGTGTSGGTTLSRPVARHTADCSSASGAAVQVSSHVEGTALAGPPNPITTPNGNDWTQVEFGAIIIQNADGSFGAHNDSIYSNDLPGAVALPTGYAANIQGVWHSHTTTGSSFWNALNRYPSPDDWSRLETALNGTNAIADPSIWITGPDGVTREFKMSEREYYEGLSDQEKAAGEGLEGRERDKSCSG